MSRSTEIQTELASQGSSLAELPLEQSFEIPQDYFNTFTPLLLQAIAQENKAEETVPVVRPLIGKSILRYAMAACITGVLGLILYVGFSPKPGVTTKEVVKVQNNAQVSEEAVAQYFEGIDDWTSEAEQAQSIDVNNLLVDIDHESISTLLTGITEKGIHQYLEQQEYSQPMTNFF